MLIRYDSLRDLLKKELENTGFIVEVEKNAGSYDRSKRGDLKVLRWEEGRDLYIDFSCVNPLTISWRGHLAKDGVGGAAEGCEMKKMVKYADKVDERSREFCPS